MRPAFLILLTVLAVPAVAQTVQSDYHVVDAVPFGLSGPRAITFLPDGRVLVAEKATGRIRVIKNGTLLAKPFVDLPVNSAGSRGAIGVAAAPDFATSKQVYVLYTRSSTGLDTNVPAQISDFRLSRFVASGDTALAETVLRNFPWDASNANHVGGALRFGPEGALYLGLGTADIGTDPALDLAQLRGKLLRLDPATGAAWPDNVFALDGDDATAPEIFCFGLHDPAYAAAYVYDQPAPPKILVTDTGNGAHDEVNEALNGKDYGWPAVQGEIDTPAESAYVDTHARYRPPAWESGAVSFGTSGVAAAVAVYGFFPLPAFFWGQAANGMIGVGWDAFTLPEPALTETFGSGFPAITDVSFPIRFPMTFMPDFDTLYVAAGNALYLVRKNGTTGVPPAGTDARLAHAGVHPARGEASVACTLPHGARGRLEIVDLRGRIVWTRELLATTTVRWDAARAAPGLYYARMLIAGRSVARLALVVL